MGFPYLKLPNLPQELIIQQLEVTDIITLSLASRKIKEVVKNAKIRIKLSWRLTKMSRSARTTIELTTSTGQRTVLEIELNDSEKWNSALVPYLSRQPGQPAHLFAPLRYPCEECLFPWQFDNFTVFVKSSDSRILLGLQPDVSDIVQRKRTRILELTNHVSHHLLTTFDVTQLDFSSDLYKYPQFIENGHNFKRFYLNSSRLTSEEVAVLLDLPQIENFTFRGSIENFVYNKPLRHKIMTLTKANWLRIEHLINTQSVVINADGVMDLTAAQLNSFLEHWIQGGCSQLESLKIRFRRPHSEDWNVLEGLETVPWDSETRPRRHGTIDCDKGRDIRRAGDGTLATVLDDGLTDFTFVVWHQKYLDG